MLTAVVVMTFAFSNAQEIKFGVKGGANLHTVTGDIKNASPKVGFQVGGFAEFKISDKFSIQPEVLYSTQGVKIKESEPELNYSSEVKLNLAYLNIPVMAKFYVVERFSLEAGPQIGFLLSASVKDNYKENDKVVRFSGNDNVKKYMESIDFGVNFGAGYDFTENLSVGARYNLGLSKLDKTEKGEEKIKRNNGVFSLSVGYKF